MRLYLSSFRCGNKPEKLLELLGDGRSTALILNAMDFVSAEDRVADLGRETEQYCRVALQRG
jgi:dipeptidase E